MANAFPEAGVWMYSFMAIVGIILIPIFPFSNYILAPVA